MRFPNLGEADLLVPLHSGVFEQPMWQSFLVQLRRVSGASHAAILLRSHLETDRLRLTLASGAWPEKLGQVMDLWPGGYGAIHESMREGRVYSLPELAEGTDEVAPLVSKLEYGFLAMSLSDPSGIDATIVLADAQHIGPAIANLLVALTPHLRVAVRTFAELERERARSIMNAAAFSRMNFGWISLDAKCCIVDCDSQAERMLQQSGVLRRGQYDRLMIATPGLDRQLSSYVRQCAENPRLRPKALNLGHDPWVDVLVSPLRIESMAGGTSSVAALYLRGDRSSSADRHEQLVDLFGLTRSEARLAWSIVQGLSIAQAAREQGLTIETARNYSKKIYAKTGARGQVDLVRHILTSVLAVA